MEAFDVIVVGAGPAGSTAAYRLARAGANVLMLERGRFPRDKPCGGGLTARALKLLPFTVDPVVEHTVDTIEARLRYGPHFQRRSGARLAVMTQRRRLDAYLAEQAVAAGAELREQARVTAVEGTTVRVGEESLTASVLIGILIVYRHPTAVAHMPAYEEPVHVVADAHGTHLEAVLPETERRDEPPGGDIPSS